MILGGLPAPPQGGGGQEGGVPFAPCRWGITGSPKESREEPVWSHGGQWRRPGAPGWRRGTQGLWVRLWRCGVCRATALGGQDVGRGRQGLSLCCPASTQGAGTLLPAEWRQGRMARRSSCRTRTATTKTTTTGRGSTRWRTHQGELPTAAGFRGVWAASCRFWRDTLGPGRRRPRERSPGWWFPWHLSLRSAGDRWVLSGLGAQADVRPYHLQLVHLHQVPSRYGVRTGRRGRAGH